LSCLRRAAQQNKVTAAPPQRFAKLQVRTGASALTAGLGRISKAAEQRVVTGMRTNPKPNNGVAIKNSYGAPYAIYAHRINGEGGMDFLGSQRRMTRIRGSKRVRGGRFISNYLWHCR